MDPTPAVPAPDLFSLAGQNVLITGASRGIGAACALALAEAGANICLVVRPAPSANLATADAIAALGRTVTTVECDLADLAAVRQVFAKALEAVGGDIHVLVNCAGIQRRSPAVQFPESDWDDVRLCLSLGRSACRPSFRLPSRSPFAPSASVAVTVARVSPAASVCGCGTRPALPRVGLLLSALLLPAYAVTVNVWPALSPRFSVRVSGRASKAGATGSRRPHRLAASEPGQRCAPCDVRHECEYGIVRLHLRARNLRLPIPSPAPSIRGIARHAISLSVSSSKRICTWWAAPLCLGPSVTGEMSSGCGVPPSDPTSLARLSHSSAGVLLSALSTQLCS
ncbi:uncharacterized protein C8Q71DRAFT_73956 [Rhodofomes roseus]|uniref:3-oxoacyl-[acyl-carrier-protein] reductase n=1 Tax=Rhodofomes roseus TaxID=34475 RepID=A0ABQ8KFG4_9APHY|nr:uncharacterized protein C8Q71DRAFT_73956 [Rhodofomes roseus]KAH9836255.1 hypothetical protein C8Q71DRAFT_73956 [Rhodofomes roseus]